MKLSRGIIHAVQKHLDGRLLDEALLYAEECYSCKKFVNGKCSLRDPLQYSHLLARGFCKEWSFTTVDRFCSDASNRVKVAFPSIALLCGGAERWLVDLTTGLDKEKYCVCAAIQERQWCDETLLKKLRGVEYLVFGKKNLQQALDSSDVSISWGYIPQSKCKNPVYCSHGCDKWTMRLISNTPKAPNYRFTAVSEVAAKPWNYLTDDICIIHNGSDEKRLHSTLTKIEAKAAIGVSSDTLLIGFISRIIPEKHPELVQKAACQLRRVNINAKALFVGNLDRIRKYSDCLYLDRVEHIGDILAALDCFMLPSESEAFSLAINEAWLARVPVVATPVGAIPELEKEYGPLVTRVDDRTKNYGACVQKAIMDIETTDRAQKVAKEHFTLSAMIKRWEEYIDGIIKS